MTPERWREIRDAFDRLAPLAPEQRASGLAELAAADPALADQVRTLFAAEGRDEWFLASPAAGPPGVVADRRGERVGPWELLSPLGEGGMGQVYLARRADTSFDKLVAVKFVHAELLSPVLRERFAAERQALAALEHPGIARLLDGGESATGQPYLVLEYVEGESLLEYGSARRLGRRQRVELFLQILAAVAHAHRHLVVHRDLKPSNILVTAAGEAKLLDFGVAKILAPPSDATDVAATRTLLRALTPEYASPEQVLGGATTTSTDVYSLGVVLFELLTGRRPYRVPTGAPEEWADAALHQSAARAPELGRDLEAIVLKALAKTPADRYTSAEAFADDLRRFLDGRPVAARPASLVVRGVKFTRRHRVGVGLAAAAALAVGSTALVALAQAAEARRERDDARRRFAQVRELAGVFLFDVHDAVAPLAGSTPARALLVETGLRYLDQLAAESAGDRELSRELAAGYERLSALQGALLAPNLGRTADALASQEKALAIRSRLASERPHDAELARELGASEIALGQVLTRLGRAGEAKAHTARAVAELERAAALETEVADSSRARGEALTTHGFVLAVGGDLDAADETMRRAVAVLEPLQAARGDDLAVGSALGMALFRQAQIRAERGEPEAAAEASSILARALALDRAMLRRAPDHPGVRRRFASDLALHGDLEAAAGDPEQGVADYGEVLALAEADRERDPSDTQAARHVAVARIRVAANLLALGRAAEAAAAVAPAVEDLGRLRAADPGNALLDFSLAEASHRLGQALSRTGKREEARARFVLAVELLEPLAERGTLTGTDAALLAEARRERAALSPR